MAPYKATVLLALAVCGHMMTIAQAVNGVYSLYPDTPTGKNNVRSAIGTCSRWVTLNPTIGLTAMGSGTLWLYLNDDCKNQVYTGFEFDVGFSINGTKSAAGTKLIGHAHSASCATGTLLDKNQAGQIYFQNITGGPQPDNMLWINAVSVPASGTLAAFTSADFIARSRNDEGATEPTPMKSFVFKDAEADTLRPTRLVCCDIALVAKPTVEYWDGKGAGCSTGKVTLTKPPPAASGATTSTTTTKITTTTGTSPSTAKAPQQPAEDNSTAAPLPVAAVATNGAGSRAALSLLVGAAVVLAALL